ncbi:MAG TPA: D-alanyl-D-alanine carboxypeptidase/D-alanyl-D-alanine-endopeptidase [Acidimicrobiales bacterium]|nr:D-alanyl-D-alanine carboxypeptidase/D-alanyl-D-alanine-endopeptidase [Acidimicrobiales bacterium]
MKWAAPAVALVAGIVLAVVAVPPSPPSGPDPAPGTVTPVLSVRRMPSLLAHEVAAARLRRALDAVLGDPANGPAREASCLAVAQGTQPLTVRRGDMPLIPASNLKLLVAAATLARLGPATRFTTTLRAATAPVAGVVDGPLWLLGSGDPLLATADYAASLKYQPALRTPVEDLVRSVVAAGITEVRGGVIGDESRYDGVRYIPTWKRGYQTDGEVGPMGALVVNDGFARFTPGKVASTAPATHAASVVTALLRAAGVTVRDEATQGRTPPTTVTVGDVSSPPLSEVVGEMLRDSDNNTAELLNKELGARVGGSQGTTAGGLVALRDTLTRAGLPVEHLRTVDASGLDRGDRVTCRLLLATLTAAGPAGPLARGLPVAGETGTLSKRFLANPSRGRLRAKTGALDEVVALTGWIDVPGGRPLAFAMVANGIPGEAAGRALQERLGAALALYPSAPPAAALGPRRAP